MGATVTPVIWQAVAGAVAGAVITEVMTPKAPELPKLEAPIVTPTRNDAGVKAAQKASLVAASQRGGRASTILSDRLGA